MSHLQSYHKIFFPSTSFFNFFPNLCRTCDYVSYYRRKSCVFSLSTLSIFDTFGENAANFRGRPLWFPDGIFPYPPAFRRFPFLRFPITRRDDGDLHKINHKNLLRRVIHTFHKVFHMSFFRNFNIFNRNDSRLICPAAGGLGKKVVGMSLHKTDMTKNSTSSCGTFAG